MKRNELIKHIELTWENLKEEGVATMLKVDESKAPIYLRANDQTVAFLLATATTNELDIKPKKYNNVSISIEKLSTETRGIVVTLNNQRFLDTFSKIAADVISATMPIDSETESVSIFTQRINSWRNIFSRGPMLILTAEEQVGLFGELEFIKALINENIPTGEVIDAWKGADAEDKDFQFQDIGIEVKSSHKQDKLVKISNIRQLDNAGYKELYLYYYSFAKSNGGSNTLPMQIDEIRSLLVGSPYLEEFESKLLNVGYNDADKESYKACYTMTYEDAYLVEDSFPKISVINVMPGILDASYTIDLNMCNDAIVTYNDLIKRLKRA